MPALTDQLKKLRHKSPREIGVRGRQELAKLSERLFGVGEMSDRGLLAEIQPASRNCSTEGSVHLIAERMREHGEHGDNRNAGALFPALAHRDEIVELMTSRFTSESDALIDRAERALIGRFDLLGFADLSFGNPVDWLLEPVSGKRAPLEHWSRIDYLNPEIAGDKKITWELNRHGHFVTLGQAYYLTRDERYAEGFVGQATAWMDANPPKLGINWASSLEVGFRSIAWLWALHLFADSARLTPTFLARLLKSLIAHGRHVEAYLSRYFSPNTHLTGEALGLFYLGVALPELRRARVWRETGLRILVEQLPLHVREDGVYFEQSTYYHRYTTDFYTHLILLAGAAKIALPLEVETSLSSLLEHLMWITRPDGSSPLIGDDDGGRLTTFGSREPTDFRDTLAVGAALFGRADWKFVAGEAPVELLWTLGPAGLARYDEIEAAPPRETSRAFPDSGCYVMRDGWSADSSYVLIDCGPHGAIGGGHAHADALAFEYASGGRTWLVDPGTFTYTGTNTGDGRERDWFRSTEAHNTVTVDGVGQSIPAGPFSWADTANSTAREFTVGDGFDYFEGSHDGYERLADPVTHVRSVLFVARASACELGKSPFSSLQPELRAAIEDSQTEVRATSGYLIVRDSFTARGHHRYAIRYHFPAGCCVTASGNQIVAMQQSDKLTLGTFGSSQARVTVESACVSRRYGQREVAPVAVIESEGNGPQEFVSVLVPSLLNRRYELR